MSDELVATFNPGDAAATVNVPLIRDGMVENMLEFFGLEIRVDENTDEDGRLFVRVGSMGSAAAIIRDSGSYICICMYVCVYVTMHVRMFYVCIYVYVCMYVCMHTYIYLYIETKHPRCKSVKPVKSSIVYACNQIIDIS